MAEVGAILRKQQEKLGELLCKKTHFLSAEIQGLLNVHRRLQMTPKSNDSNAGILDRLSSLYIFKSGYNFIFDYAILWLIFFYHSAPQVVDLDKMDRSRFREFLHNAFDMTDDILLDRIFKYFDSDNDGYIGREEWIMGLSVFLKGNMTSYQPV